MATPTDQQLIKRAVYDDAGNKIREGLVPTSVANTRPALLEFWAAEDARIAEEEALAAQAEAERLAAMEQSPATESMVIPALQQRVKELETIATQHADLLGQLESAQPDEVLRAAAQLQLAAGAAQAVEATGLQIEQRIAATAAEATSRLDALDQRQAASIAQVADVVVGARQQVELSTAQAVADAKRQVSSFLTTATARVADMKGPRGAVGAAGAATTVGAGVPQGPDAVMPLLGRGAVMGDIYIDGADDSRHAYRWDGKSSWEKGMPMTSIQIRDVKVSALDASTKVTSLQTISGGGNSGLGGGGGESLLSRTVPSGGSAMLSESARWAIPLAVAGLPAPDACTVTLELTAADGGNAGKKLFITGKVLYEGLATPPSSFTVYSELGELVGRVTVDVTIQSAPAVLPPGLPAVTIPPGVVSYQLFASISSNTTGATQFLLAGAVSWMQPNAVIPGGATTPPQIVPAWSLV